MFTNNVGYSGGTHPSSNDEEGPFNVTGADSDESEEKRSNFLISTLKCSITLIPKLAALAFSLVLAEVILLMFVADYGFVDYFLSIYYLIFLTVMIIGEIPISSIMVDFFKGKLLSKWGIRGFCFTFLALSVREQLSYVAGNGILANETLSITVTIVNWVSLIFGIIFLLLGPAPLKKMIDLDSEEEVNPEEDVELGNTESEVISNIQDLHDTSESGTTDAEETEENRMDDETSRSETLYSRPKSDVEEEEEEEVEEETFSPPRQKHIYHQLLEFFPLFTIFPTILVLIEVFVMLCIISYNAVQVLVRVYFLAIGMILVVGEVVSMQPKDQRIVPYVRQGFLENWFIRGFLYIFFCVSVMQQHIQADRDGLMESTRIPRSDWDAKAASAFWGLFNWSSFLVYICYTILGLYRMDSHLDELEDEYKREIGRYDSNPRYTE